MSRARRRQAEVGRILSCLFPFGLRISRALIRRAEIVATLYNPSRWRPAHFDAWTSFGHHWFEARSGAAVCGWCGVCDLSASFSDKSRFAPSASFD
jgi:hypothetical protein